MTPSLARRLTLLLLVIVMGAPVAAGLGATLLPALGITPALGLTMPSLEAFARVLARPGLADSIAITLWVGFASTLISLVLAMAVPMAFAASRPPRWLETLLSPLVAVPHAAMALGLLMLLSADFGWIPRLLGLDPRTGPRLAGDSLGVSLILGLVVKETPFLLLLILAALGGVDADRRLRVARSLGYSPGLAWAKGVAPLIYARIRLPVLAVLGYGLSGVEMPILIGPPTDLLAQRVLEWIRDPRLTDPAQAAAGAVLLLLLVAGAIALWLAGEWLLTRAARAWRSAGDRRGLGAAGHRPALLIPAVTFLVSALAVAILALWAFTRPALFRQRLWPEALTTQTWALHAHSVTAVLGPTLWLAVGSTVLGAILVVALLEAEAATRRPLPRAAEVMLFAPLVLPQLGFLIGVTLILLELRLEGGWIGLIWTHLLFVVPYLYLVLAGPWRRLDPRLAQVAASLGHGRWSRFWRVRCGLLVKPLAVALAIGAAVSIAQYLPTLFAGAGRVRTVTLEVMATSTLDKSLQAVHGLLQVLLPLALFWLATGFANMRIHLVSGPGRRA